MPKKQTTTIVKPEKVLREALQKRKKEFEKKGWVFTENPASGKWRAQIKKPGALGGEKFSTEEFDSFNYLLSQVEEFQKSFEQEWIDKKIAETEKPVAIETAKLTAAIVEDANAPNPVVSINVEQIVPNRFEPQARRRAKFKDGELDVLGDSIARHGLLQPIGVRRAEIITSENPDLEFFEIVFGERRWAASKRANLKTINCVVLKLTDAESLELQYDENHKQSALDPLDDAFFFKYLKEREGYTDAQLADRLGTTKENVANKLKLNDLVPEAVAELNDGKLPLKHAYYLAKFSAPVQRQIVDAQYAYKYQDRTEAVVSYSEFKEEVEENILRRLEGAPFDRDDVRLHIKGLICADCTERTGYAPALFTDLSRGDSCLNKSCFDVKTNTHLRLERDRIAAARPNPTNIPLDEIAADVPLVTDRKYAQEERTPFREKPLTNQKFLEKPECEHSVAALIVEGARKGEQTFICKSDECETHNPKPVLDETGMKLKEAEFDKKVEHLTREKIFAGAMKFFDEYTVFWQFDDLIKNLLVEFIWEVRNSHDSNILWLIKDWKKAPKNFREKSAVAEFVETLDKAHQSRLLFLLSKLNELSAGYGKSDDPNVIRKIAKDYARLDYKLLDAEARVELAQPEFKQSAAAYLEAVLTGIPANPPAFWRGADEAPGNEQENAAQPVDAVELSQTLH